MIGSIWVSTAVAVTVIFSASITYKSYNDIQEAKEVQESYEIIRDIKNTLAQQYNKSPQDITRDEIIAYLPRGKNWEKVLLLDRNNNSDLSNKEMVDIDGNFVLSENEKIKLLALKAKLKNISDVDNLVAVDGKITFVSGMKDKNFAYKDINIKNQIIKVIEIIEIKNIATTLVLSVYNKIIEDYTPYDDIYHNMKNTKIEVVSDIEILTRKRTYFKNQIKKELLLSKSAKDMKIYNLIKGLE